MKTTIVINNCNSIDEICELLPKVINTCKYNGITVNKVILSSRFEDDFEKVIYDDNNDFVITYGTNNSNIKGTKKVFELDHDIDNTIISIVHFSDAMNKNNKTKLTLKTFGKSEREILNILESIECDDLDVEVMIEYDNSLELDSRQDMISNIYEKLKPYMYTDENMSIYELIMNLLNVNGKTLSVAETLTQGNIAKNLTNADNNGRFKLGIVAHSAKQFEEMLALSSSIVNSHNQNMVELVYEMAAGLLEKSDSDYAIATLGNLEDDFSYIAVGDIDGIHVYKSKCSLHGVRKINTISKNAIYYLIKKIKQNDLFFNQIIV